METCSLAALITCFSWAHLYLETDVEMIRQPDRTFVDTYYGETLHVLPADGGPDYIQKNVIREMDSSNRAIHNPYAGLSLGYEVNIDNVRIDLSGFYRESARISDEPEIGAAFRVRWFPFGRH